MFPDQQNNNGGNQPIQTPDGQYQVVPPLPAANNTGHSGHNPYEFIVNPNTPSRRGPLLGGSFGMRIAVVLGGVVLLMVLIALASSAFKPKSSTAGLVAIAQRQQEIVRVATAAGTQATGQDTKNFVASVQMTVASGQYQVTTYLSTHGKKLNTKTLALDRNAQTDTLLANAGTANNYDSAVAQNLSGQLETYEAQLQTTFKQTSSKTLKQILQVCFESAQKLIDQAKSIGS